MKSQQFSFGHFIINKIQTHIRKLFTPRKCIETNYYLFIDVKMSVILLILLIIIEKEHNTPFYHAYHNLCE